MPSWNPSGVCLVSSVEARTEETLFKFVPQYPMEGDILKAHFLQIQHHSTGTYIHAGRAAEGAAAASIPEDESVLAKALSGEEEGGGKAKIMLTAGKNAIDSDIFAVKGVEMTLIKDLSYAINSLGPYEDFLAQASEPSSLP